MLVYHMKEKGHSRFSDEDFEDHQPFPTLQKALETVPQCCGFNIEVKWTMQMKDGTYELQHPFELNSFLDLILKMVLEFGGQRKIVFSCFHPDICTMLRLKQNCYPVLFLTQGITELWPPYEDKLTSTIRQAVLYATIADILGINVHTEDILRDPSQVQMAVNHKLVVFCWGDDNNNQETIKFLKGLGLHGIIYDKIDVYNTKEKKESVFLCEEREAQESVLKAASSSCENSLDVDHMKSRTEGVSQPQDIATSSDSPSCASNCNDSRGQVPISVSSKNGSPTSFCGILINASIDSDVKS